MFAAWYNLRELLRRKANVDEVTELYRGTALHFAVCGRHQEAVGVLTENGADPQAATTGDIEGITAIDRARVYGNVPLLQLLEQARDECHRRLHELNIQALAGIGVYDFSRG